MNHEPVLLQEVVEFLRPNREDGTFVDATVGAGGHAAGLLERYPKTRLVAIDRDPRALEVARGRVRRFAGRVTFVQGRHEKLIDILKQSNVGTISGLLADLGVSSMQFDDAARGFSFRFDAPLDMRMGPEGRSAADLVNDLDEDTLAKILRDYGEEPRARAIARAIVAARPVETTARLAEIVRRAAGFRQGQKSDPATRTFQAIRIHLNAELDELEEGLAAAERALKPGG